MKETELFERMKEKLYTPVVGDILDAKGYMHQFLPQNIRPLRDDMKIAGRAMTVLMIDVFRKQQKPFGRLCECLDQIQPNEIYIVAGSTKRCAYWGELLTATAKERGGNGEKRLEYFAEIGTMISDNGIEDFSWRDYSVQEIEDIFAKAAG